MEKGQKNTRYQDKLYGIDGRKIDKKILLHGNINVGLLYVSKVQNHISWYKNLAVPYA